MIRKTIMVLLFMAMVPLAFTGCELSDGGSDGSGSGSVATQKTLKVMDASGKELGVCVESSPYEINIISKNGYYYNIYWNGNFSDSGDLYYSGANLAGTPYYSKYKFDAGVIHYKVICCSPTHNQLYTISNFDSNNLAIHEDTVTINSREGDDGSSHSASADTSQYNYYELRTITREEAGIPETISLPISIVEK